MEPLTTFRKISPEAVSFTDQQIIDQYRDTDSGAVAYDDDEAASRLNLFSALYNASATPVRRGLTRELVSPDPGGDTYFDDFFDGLRIGAYHRPLQGLAFASEGVPVLEALFGGAERGREIGDRIENDPSLNIEHEGVAFVGSAIGSALPTLGALATGPAGTAVAAGVFGASAFGFGRQRYRDFKEQQGEETTALGEFATGLGYGVSEFLAERLGIKALAKVSATSAREIGKRVLRQGAAKNPGLTGAVVQAVTTGAAVGAAEETLAEIGMGLTNAILDPADRTISALVSGLPEAALGGAIGGSFVSSVAATGDIIKNRSEIESLEVGDDQFRAERDLPPPRGEFNTVAQFGRKHLTARGDQPETIWQRDVQRRREYAADEFVVNTNIANLRTALKKAYGVRGGGGVRGSIERALGGGDINVPPEVVHLMNLAMGNASVEPFDVKAVSTDGPGQPIPGDPPNTIRTPFPEPDMAQVEKDVRRAMKGASKEELRIAMERAKAQAGERIRKNREFIAERKKQIAKESLAQLPEEVRAPIVMMRQHIDALSAKLIDDGVVRGQLDAVIEDNLGVYLRRSFKAFTVGRDLEDVPMEVRNKMEALLRSELGDPVTIDEETGQSTVNYLPEQVMRNILYNAHPENNRAGLGLLSVANTAVIPARLSKMLQRRRAMPKTMREFLGEVNDVGVNYAATAHQVASLLSQYRFARDVAKNEIGVTLWAQDDPSKPADATVPVSSVNKIAGQPLAGLVTFKEVAETFKHQDAVSSPYFTSYMKAVAATKTAATALSLQAQVRNFMSNPGFLMFNGMLNIYSPSSWVKVGKAMKIASHLVGPRVKGTSQDSGINDQIQRLIDYGLFGQDPRTGELRDMAKEAGLVLDDATKFSLSNQAPFTRRLTNFALRTYQTGDEFWKVVAFEVELDRHMKAWGIKNRHEVTEQQERLVAEKVTKTLPSYDLINSNLVKAARRNPIVAPFVSFPIAVLTNAINTAKLVKAELNDPNPGIQSIAKKRIAGMLQMAMLPTAMSIYSRMEAGITEEEDRDLRKFMPEWQRNSQFLYLSLDRDKGEYSFVDLTYTDPFNFIRRPFIAMIKGADEGTAITEALREMVSPFTSEEILTKSLLEVRANKTESGREVYNPQADVGERVSAMVAHVAQGFIPGIFKSADRILAGFDGEVQSSGQAFGPVQEAFSAALGFRVSKRNLSQMLSFQTSRFVGTLGDTTRLFTETASRAGSVEPSEIAESFGDMLRRRQVIFEDMHDKASLMIKLGMKRSDVERILSGGGISRANRRAIMMGRVPPYRGSKRLTDRLREKLVKRNAEAEDRSRQLGELARRAAVIRNLERTQ